jgi:dihydrolipoamide dehydrogenase
VGRFPFSASARAQMYGEKTGWVKTIHETRYGELLGLVIVGPQATELVNAGVIGITAEATIETLADSIAAHPTLAEAVKEAALVALGRQIHLPPARGGRAKAAAAR